jgi:mannose-6-phosphate isomerase-like protein (cupin superfamily)
LRIPLAEAIKNVPQSDGRRWAALFQHGTLEIEIYAPRGNDPQQPHKKDEVYVVAQGSGEFACGRERVQFVAGDLLFVPAGETHQFEKFSDDFVAWVIFYGPDGGETST